jgi:hypothetical protein
VIFRFDHNAIASLDLADQVLERFRPHVPLTYAVIPLA